MLDRLKQELRHVDLSNLCVDEKRILAFLDGNEMLNVGEIDDLCTELNLELVFMKAS